jgi:hypothetical protein
MDKKNLIVCAVLENEAAYLPEWLAYHRLVGIAHFVLYDNGSTDDPARAVRACGLAEHVTLIRWPQRPGRIEAYRHFIDIFSPGFDWAAFLDVDEFLLPLNSRNVMDTLERLSGASAVLVHRRVFGPGPWQEPPRGLVIENYGLRAPDEFPANRQVRTIARCADLLDVTENPHEFRVHGPVFNTAGQLVPNAAVQAQPCYQNLVINHYYTRSRRDWLAKLQRNDAPADAAAPKEDPGLFDHLAAVCRVQDATIQAFAATVREVLGLDAAVPAPEAAAPLPIMPAVAGTPTAPAVASPSAMPAAQVMGGLPTVVEAPVMAGSPAVTVTPTVAEAPTELPRMPGSPGAAVPAQPARGTADGIPGPRSTSGVAGSVPVDAAPSWVSRGQDAQERSGGLGLVFRDRSRPGEHWIAALRGAAVDLIDPAFLLDEYDRIRDFPTAAEARAACDAALAQVPRH